MKAEPVNGVRPSVLRWARESAHLTTSEVAERLKKSVAVIEAWEEGTSAPTYSQLETLAYELYKRPLALFFLPNAPEELTPRVEFRSLPERDLSELKRDTVFLIRRARAYQIALEELFEGRSPAESPLWRHLRLAPGQAIASVATHIRAELGLPFEAQMATHIGSDDDALKRWRAAIEARGIFVFKHTFKQADISGFCIRHAEFPVIMINNSTTKTRQIFSLLHELAHLLADRSGISSFDETKIQRLIPREREIEVYCNAVAAEILVPDSDFRVQAARLPGDAETAEDSVFAAIAERYHISRAVVLRRLLNYGRVSQAFYDSKTRQWDAQRAERTPGGNYYATQNAYLSERFLREVFSRYARRQISREDAADLVGIAPKNVERLQDQFMQAFAA